MINTFKRKTLRYERVLWLVIFVLEGFHKFMYLLNSIIKSFVHLFSFHHKAIFISYPVDFLVIAFWNPLHMMPPKKFIYIPWELLYAPKLFYAALLCWFLSKHHPRLACHSWLADEKSAESWNSPIKEKHSWRMEHRSRCCVMKHHYLALKCCLQSWSTHLEDP